MGTVDDTLARRHLIEFFDEDRSPAGEIFNHVTVVDNFAANVDRSTVGIERQVDDVDSANDTRAKAARLKQVDDLV